MLKTMTKVNLILSKPKIDYSTYCNQVFALADNEKTSGSDQSNDRIEATKLNTQRIKRIEKHTELLPEIKAGLSKINNKWLWIIITESWCGDGAQNISIINKMVDAMPNVTLQLIFRDENIDVINEYLTNGNKSIPKLVCIDNQYFKEIGTWGPRPVAIQEKVNVLKKEQPSISHYELVKNIHLWYAKDKGESLQKELFTLIKQWSNES